MAKIHPTAIIDPQAHIGAGVEVGSYSVIGANVKIGDNSVIKSHVVIDGHTEIGRGNVIYPFAVIGTPPQDLKYAGEVTYIKIGDNNRIREHVTIHPGTVTGANVTTVGNNNLLMVGVHIAHDCVVGNNIVLANNATLAGHVQVGDNTVIGGLSAVHQFVRIGHGAMIGGMSGVESDVIPFGLVMGERASLAGLNLVGMKRRNLPREEIHALRNFFKKIFENNDGSFIKRVDAAASEFNNDAVRDVIDFIKSESSRSFCQPKNGVIE